MFICTISGVFVMYVCLCVHIHMCVSVYMYVCVHSLFVKLV